MSQLFLKKNGRAVRISRASADKVDQIIQDTTIPDDDWIVIPEYTGTKKSIEGVQKVDDEDRSEQHFSNLKNNDDTLEKSNKDYENRVRTLVSTHPTEKAKNINIAASIYLGFTGKKAPESFLLEVKKRQEIYFSQNKRHPYANPTCYKDLLPGIEKTPQYENMVHVKPLVSHASIRLAERIVVEALRTAKALHLV